MSQIINESTSVVQVDSSRLQNGAYATVYVSTTIPGQLVTVMDTKGFLSSPQSILLSTIGPLFSDGSFSTLITQKFGYITLASQNHTWSIVNQAAFPAPTASYRAVDARSMAANNLITDGISSVTTSIRGIDTQSNSANATAINILYVNSLSRFLSSSTIDSRFTVNGSGYIQGSTITVGAASFRDSVSTLGDFFNAGNISSKNGTIYVGGNVTVNGSIRGQRGNVIAASYLSSMSTASFRGSVNIASTVVSEKFISARSIVTPLTTGVSMNVMSSMVFSPTQAIRNVPGYFNIIGVQATTPSVSTNSLVASNSIQTSNLSLQSFTPSPTLSSFTLGSTNITNAGGSLSISSIAGNIFTSQRLQIHKANDSGDLTTNFIKMNDSGAAPPFTLQYSGGSFQVPSYWVISSIGTNGTFNSPLGIISTNNLVGSTINAENLITINDTIQNCYVNNIDVNDSLNFTNVNTASVKNVFINNSMGSIIGSRTETIQSVFCSSMRTDEILVPGVLHFGDTQTMKLPNTYISTLAANSIVTSSLNTSLIYTGSLEQYSTINPSTPWIQISSYQLNAPFNATAGLGTYFNKVSFIGTQTQTAYYSMFDPSAQTKVALSTPYVNTVGLPTGAFGQAASDSEQNVYVGAKNNGWKLERLTPTGTTTIAGNYQYFYGDGGYPLNAAFGPRLAVSMASPGALLITDISNVRIRYVTTDPIVTTIAGTGATGFTGGNAFNATFSNPTTTATDISGRIFITDTGNNVIRVIQHDSTIATYGGTGVAGNTGDGGPARIATLSRPFGLVATGNTILFTDLSNCVIRSITPDSTIQLVAGTYTPGFSGDTGPATAAALSYPRGITVDSANNIYFCDTGNDRVRRIDAITSVITTVAGNGTPGFAGDGGPAVNANLSSPTGVATDVAGNLYIADTNNQCIRFVNMTTAKIATVAGRPRVAGYGGDTSFANFATLNYPSHIVFDPTSQYYYFADDSNCRVRYVNTNTNIIFSAAGNGSPISTGDGGPAINAVFGSINSVATDISNNIYVADGLGNAIRKIDYVTSTITKVIGTGIGGYNGDGPALSTRISTPQTIFIDSNTNLYFTDTNNQRVRYLNSQDNTINTLAGTGVAGYNGDGISSIEAQLNFPGPLTRAATGEIFVGDSSNYRIRQLGTDGMITTYAGNGIYDDPNPGIPLNFPLGIVQAITTTGGQLYMTDSTTSAIWYLNQTQNAMQPITGLSTAAYLGDGAPLSNAYFNNPTGLAADNSGNFMITDSGNARVRRTYTFGYPLNPVYISMNFNYTNYFTSTGSAYISINGNLLSTFSGSNQESGSFSIANVNLLDYPIQTSNPVYGNQVPFIEVTQLSTFGYSKLDGNIWLEAVPGQGLLHDSVDTNSGIIMNTGSLVFPYQNNGITLQNKYNDASLRTVNYTGSIVSASDPALKEHIQAADLSICYTTLANLPLRRYTYCEPYLSTFQVRDHRRLGFLTSEVAPHFPNSIRETSLVHDWAPSSINTLDTTQIKYTHIGVTQSLIEMVSALEAEVEEARSTMRRLVAQRKNVL